MINIKGHTLVCFTFFILYSFEIFSQESIDRIRSSNYVVEKYGLFETEFVTDSTYNNPYVEVSLSAHVSGPGDTEFDVNGYWYGGNLWKLRTMPIATGHWSYTTFSNDPDLDSLMGAFDCVPSSRPGILIVNPDYPYTFKLSEGGPFFWMGETSWCLMSNAVPYTDSTFHCYINKRLEQKFNGIHFVLGTGGLPVGTKNPENEGGKLWISQQDQRINPEFFRWVDKRIAYIDSIQMAIGFFITWSQHFVTFTQEEFERFERYLIARYAAYPLIYWVIVGEYDEAGTIEDYNYHGQVIHDRDPYGHLISNHPGHRDLQNLGTSRIFTNQEWFSFVMQQLPQYPMYASPSEINGYILKDRIYNMPVVNLESGYEGNNYYGRIMSGNCLRKYAWAIVLGGGFLSYGHKETIRKVNLNALESDGVTYMVHLYNFFKQINWWEMNPDTEKVDYGFCLAGPSSNYIIYLPDSGTVNIDLTMDSVAFQAQWYNPRDGCYINDIVVEGGGIQSFTSIYAEDAVLHLFKISEKLNADFSAEPTVGEAPLAVNFTDLSTGLIDTWYWDFGDGATSTYQNPTHKYASEGFYNVSLTVSGATGQVTETKVNYIKVTEIRLSIFGEMLYYNENRYIHEAILNLTHAEGNSADTTDTNGAYLFEAILNGDVELIPFKKDDPGDFITGLDALLVLQYLAVLENLTEDQKFTADVTEDGDVTNSDAFAILHYLTFYMENFGSTGQWRFKPATSAFHLRADTAVDFKAFLLGDVNGDWDGIGETDQKVIGSGNQSDSIATILKISEVNASGQREILVPIKVAELENTLHTLILSIKYDPQFLKYISTQKTHSSSKFMIAANGAEPGKVHIAMAGITGMKQDGEIINLLFAVKNQISHSECTDLEIMRAFINDKKVINIVNGRVYFSDTELMNVPDHFTVFQNHPNPFNPTTTICFDLPFDAKVLVNIYNALGQKVITLLSDTLSGGSHQIIWHALNEFGESVNSGIYFYQIKVKEVENGKSYLVIKKMFLLK